TSTDGGSSTGTTTTSTGGSTGTSGTSTGDTTGGDPPATTGSSTSGSIGGPTAVPTPTTIPPPATPATPGANDDRTRQPARAAANISGGRYLSTALQTVRGRGGIEGRLTLIVEELDAPGIDGGWSVMLSVDHRDGTFVPQPPSPVGDDRGEIRDHGVAVAAGGGTVHLFDVLSQSSDHAYFARYAQTGVLRLGPLGDGPRPTVTVTVLQ
ncbi:MAG: hypothetical protein LC708_01675, partial [Actinobacteria bacterium]|nr:hypothetical protein [Actinomycetota bacterium]